MGDRELHVRRPWRIGKPSISRSIGHGFGVREGIRERQLLSRRNGFQQKQESTK